MPSCIAPLCPSGRGKKKGEAKQPKIHLFTFPDDKIIRCRWIRQLRKDPKRWQPGKSARLCPLHFEPQCFVSADLNRDKRGRPLKTSAMQCLPLSALRQSNRQFSWISANFWHLLHAILPHPKPSTALTPSFLVSVLCAFVSSTLFLPWGWKDVFQLPSRHT